jgi:energy-coupling factor transporter transmembrane protein EcfT
MRIALSRWMSLALMMLNQALSRALRVATAMPSRYLVSKPKMRKSAAITTSPSTTS